MNLKRTYALSILLTFGGISVASAQESTSKINPSARIENSDDTKPVKPGDGHPYVFSSEEDRATCVAKKRDAILEDIKKNSSNPEMIIRLREELWRLDNAIVKKN